MKFTLSWLKNHLQTDASLEEISRSLTNIGLEVEEITDNSAALKEFKIAQIIATEKHPNADKLQICKVNNGTQELQIVCGASNARSGIKVTLAEVGAIIPNGNFKIKQSKIRDVESNGMLCSASELNLSDEAEGIIELPENAVVGESIVSALGLDDPVIEIAITPDRADCCGVYGIARDLAAAGLGKLKELQIPEPETKIADDFEIKVETESCHEFNGCIIKNVSNCESPLWLRQKLEAIGLRPISVLVDITNYITYDLGRPLHIYDLDKLNGFITARDGKKEDGKLNALDGKEYQISETDCVIGDADGILGLGGIIGGESSGCSMETRNILIESAIFDPVTIARTGRRLGVLTDARYRFERGIDPEFAVNGAKICAQMVLELCGGEPSEIKTVSNKKHKIQEVEYDFALIKSLTGINIEKQKAEEILSKLGFKINGNRIEVPAWRHDIEGKADIVEEVLRIYGYNQLESKKVVNLNDYKKSRESNNLKAKKFLGSLGYSEVKSWAFISPKKTMSFGIILNENTVKNPISEELSQMRASLIPNLLDAVSLNQARGFFNIMLFEQGNVFKENGTAENNICGIICGDTGSNSAHGKARKSDIFDAKAHVFSLIEEIGLNPQNLRINRDAPGYYHPAKSAGLSLGKEHIGFFGEIHPQIVKDFDIKGQVYAFEIALKGLPAKKDKLPAKPEYKTSDYQAVKRDFAFTVDEKMQVEQIISSAKSVDKKLIKNVNIFDIYQGKNLDEGKKSVAFSVEIQSDQKTLEEKEIEQLSSNIIDKITSLGGKLRT